MGKLIAGIKGVFGKLAAGIRELPVETALCLTYFLVFVFERPIGAELEEFGLNADIHPFLIFWFIPNIVLCFTLNKFKGRIKIAKYLYYFSWFVWIPLMLWASEPDKWSVGVSYLLAFIALVIGTERMDNPSFGKNAVKVAVRGGEGLLVGGVVFCLFIILGVSVEFLFKLSPNEGLPLDLLAFIVFVLIPLLCLSLLNDYEPFDKGKKLLRILIDRVLSIGLIIYAIILYCYIIRILICWELPDGGVAYLVLGFLIVALVCYLLRLQLENRHYEWFFKAFPAVAFAPLVLLWIGVSRRIGDYGLTDSRLYLIVLSFLVSVFVAMLINERTRRFQLMALVLAVAAIVFTYIPGIRAKDFGIRNQKARLERLLPEVLEDGEFPLVFKYNELVQDTIRCRNYEECYGAWNYLKDNMDKVAFEKDYGKYGDFYLDAGKIRDAKKGLPADVSYLAVGHRSLQCMQQTLMWSYAMLEGDINLGPYTDLVTDYRQEKDFSGIAVCDDDNPSDTLIYCLVLERVASSDKNTPAADMLIYENDMYKAILGSVQYDPEYGLECHVTLLLKKP